MENNLLTATEAGQVLGVCREYLYRLVKARELRVVRVGRRGIRFREEDLRAFIEKRLSGGHDDE